MVYGCAAHSSTEKNTSTLKDKQRLSSKRQGAIPTAETYRYIRSISTVKHDSNQNQQAFYDMLSANTIYMRAKERQRSPCTHEIKRSPTSPQKTVLCTGAP